MSSNTLIKSWIMAVANSIGNIFAIKFVTGIIATRMKSAQEQQSVSRSPSMRMKYYAN